MASANHPAQDLAPIPMAVVAAEATDRLHVGFRVLCVDYHNPVVLAKELATIDDLSGGRLEIGLGAGWIGAEYDAMGIAFESASARIRRLGDVVDLLRELYANETELSMTRDSGVRAVGFKAWTTDGSRRCPPIAIGGGGAKVLDLAAHKADILAINFDNRAGALTPDGATRTAHDQLAERLSRVRAAAGERWPHLRIEAGVVAAAIADDRVAAASRFEPLFGMPAEAVLEHPLCLIGDVAQVVDRVQELRERYGVTDFTIRDGLLDEFEPVLARLPEL